MTSRTVGHGWIALSGALTLVAMGCSAQDGRGRSGGDAGTGGGDAATGDDGGGPGPTCVVDFSDGDCDDPEVAERLRASDSDRDGLSDYRELCETFTDPCEIDTDGDGVTDLGEAEGTMTDPLDETSTIPEGDFFVVLPYMGPHEERTLRFGTNIKIADVYFLIDTTGSMGSAIDNVRSSLRMIADQIAMRIPDVQMGVGRFDDFPFDSDECEEVPGFGCVDVGGYGGAGDVPYENQQDITADVPSVQAALDSLTAAGGADGPESHVEAIYQTATGEGGSWTGSGGGSFSLPPKTCSSIPDSPGRPVGYPCFRPGALPIVVAVSDAPWHNGPGGSNAYSGISPAPHTFDQAASALGGIGGRFVGVAVNGGGRSEHEEMATGTGTVDASGSPLVYDAPSGNVSETIVDGIGSIAGGVKQDVGTRTENVPGNPDDFDATLFIKSITPVEGYKPDGTAGGYESKDDTTFYGVIPGTMVDFAIDFHNDVREPADTAEIFQAQIIVVGNGVATLDSRNVYIIVPPEGGTILI